MNTNNTPSWEEEFDESFPAKSEYGFQVLYGVDDIKSFIKEHFIPREKVREVVEGMRQKNEQGNITDLGYRQAMDDVLKALVGDETK